MNLLDAHNHVALLTARPAQNLNRQFFLGISFAVIG
jgi:hypothetical protein